MKTLVDLIGLRAQQQPDHIAYRYLGHGDEIEAQCTFAELDRDARAIAHALLQQLNPGDRALLLYPLGLDFIAAFFGCLYAGVIAVPSYVPIRERELKRLLAIAMSSKPRAVLGTRAIVSSVRQKTGALPDLLWLATDMPLAPASIEPVALTGDSLAFLQYTSGSTGWPKGVMVSHAGILANEQMIKEGFGHDQDMTVVGWLPHFHDMGLIGNILQPLYVGGNAVLISPMDFLRDPHKWLRAISRFRAHTSGAPNFGYKLCVTRRPTSLEGIDLSSWRVAYTGSEPIQAETLTAFTRAFEIYGFRADAFYPCYGLAEATLFVTGVRKGQGYLTSSRDGRTRVGCGRAWGEEDVRVVDLDSRLPVKDGEEGEIWVAGPHVAAGYWDRLEETEQTFGARLPGSDLRYLRTGDLGFFEDGQLYVSGRLKDLVVVRGENHYPQDIEVTVEASHPAVRPGCVAAFAIDGPEDRLAVVAEVTPDKVNGHAQAICDRIREAVTEEHGLRAHLVVLTPPGNILRTSSGKVQRRATREALAAGRLRLIEPKWRTIHDGQ